MRTLDELLEDANRAHGHLCAGQVLGVRMAMLGMEKLGIDDPTGKDRKRVVTFVEIDRCVTDAIPVVTGCRLGKRALKFRDFGKVAATFCDLQENRAVRLVARESSKQRAREIHPEIENKNQQQMQAYREMTDDELFEVLHGRIDVGEVQRLLDGGTQFGIRDQDGLTRKPGCKSRPDLIRIKNIHLS